VKGAFIIINKSIDQSNHSYIAHYVANESEAHNGGGVGSVFTFTHDHCSNS